MVMVAWVGQAWGDGCADSAMLSRSTASVLAKFGSLGEFELVVSIAIVQHSVRS